MLDRVGQSDCASAAPVSSDASAIAAADLVNIRWMLIVVPGYAAERWPHSSAVASRAPSAGSSAGPVYSSS